MNPVSDIFQLLLDAMSEKDKKSIMKWLKRRKKRENNKR